MMKKRKMITNRPDRQTVRKINKRKQLIKPYGKKPAQAPA
jgi:hypothetical protein